MNQDKDFMSIALDLARLAKGRTSPNPAVGCVIARQGKILSTGFHKQAGLPHAEAEALARIKGVRGKGVRLYVTLEPCCHFGRTGPCTEAIIKSGIRAVVIGMRDPDPKVKGKGVRRLRQAGIKVRVGVLEEECRELNRDYIVHRTKLRPFITLKMAMTLGGVVGWKGRGELSPRLHVTGPKAQRLAHEYRDQVDAILVGTNTVLADNPRLTTRLPGGVGKDPIRIILDSHLRIPLSAKVLNLNSSAKTWVVTSPRSSRQEKVELLRDRGVEVITCPAGRQGRIALKPLMRIIGRKGIVSLLVEGGPTVWRSFLKEGLIDQWLCFLGTGREPKVSAARLIKAPLEWCRLPLKNLSGQTAGRDLLIRGIN